MAKNKDSFRKRTTVFMNPNLHRELHISAVRQNRKVAECLEEAIADFVAKYEKKPMKKIK